MILVLGGCGKWMDALTCWKGFFRPKIPFKYFKINYKTEGLFLKNISPLSETFRYFTSCTVLYVVTGRSPATDGTGLCSGPSVLQRHAGWF